MLDEDPGWFCGVVVSVVGTSYFKKIPSEVSVKYSGSCHCQKVKFEVETEITEALSCNCSICTRRGHLLHFVPKNQLNLLSGQNDLTDYQWGKKSIHFLFCSTCGVAPFGHGPSPHGEMAAVNIRCLENFSYESIPLKNFDGKSLP